MCQMADNKMICRRHHKRAQLGIGLWVLTPAGTQSPGGVEMSEEEKADFARKFVAALTESDEMQRILVEFISSCPNIKTEF